MKKIVTYISFLLLSGVTYALDIKINENSQRYKESTGKSLWFGRVEGSRAYKGRNGETVIEFYCHKLEPVEKDKLFDYEHIVYVDPKKEKEIHFVATLRTPEMKLEKADKLLQKMASNIHFCYYPKGVVSNEGYFADKKAPFIAGGFVISDKYKVKDTE